MTLVGTLRTNRKEVPAVMKDKINRDYGSSAFLFTKEMTTVSYVPATTSKTKKKLVLLLPSMHSQPKVSTQSGKPEIVEYYKSIPRVALTHLTKCVQHTLVREEQK
ncbi:UNVERIFIED_CONTAM: hypothetical protein RMT77_005109 [Armadillidium vulgare]